MSFEMDVGSRGESSFAKSMETGSFDPDRRVDIRSSAESSGAAFDPDRRVDPETLRTRMENERIARYRDAYLPRKERFDGEVGNSLARPDVSTKTGAEAKELLDARGLHGIEYRNGSPDFSVVALESVQIPRMTADREENYKQAYQAVAEKWNAESHEGRTDWTASDVKQWKKENGLVVHEKEDLKTCEFVPECIHRHFSHIGGRLISAIRGIFSERQVRMMQQKEDFNDQFDA